MSLDLSPLNKTLRLKTGEEESVKPCLFLTLYSRATLRVLAPRAAVALNAFLEVIPKDTLRSCDVRDTYGRLTRQRIARDLRQMERPAKNDDFIRLIYSSGERGPPGDHGLLFLIDDLEDPDMGPMDTNYLRFEFPWNAAERDQVDQFIGKLVRLAAPIPFATGTAGFGFSHNRFDRFARAQVNAMLARYAGFDHSEDYARDRMGGRTPSAHWINFVSAEVVEQLGGKAALASKAPMAEVRDVEGGLMVRGAKYPPLGDVNRGAPDIGGLPLVAEWLRPLRFPFKQYDSSNVPIDAAAWLARLDGLAPGPWENR